MNGLGYEEVESKKTEKKKARRKNRKIAEGIDTNDISSEAEFEKNHPDLVTEINNTNAPWEAAKIALTGDAGTISIVHFDLVHGRFTANVAGKQRHMVKFLFARNEEPT